MNGKHGAVIFNPCTIMDENGRMVHDFEEQRLSYREPDFERDTPAWPMPLGSAWRYTNARRCRARLQAVALLSIGLLAGALVMTGIMAVLGRLG